MKFSYNEKICVFVVEKFHCKKIQLLSQNIIYFGQKYNFQKNSSKKTYICGFDVINCLNGWAKFLRQVLENKLVVF